MAKDSDDCEFWLPPQFLTDDEDLFAEFKNNKNDGRSDKGFWRDNQHEFLYRFGPLGPYSDLSSPVEGSTETDSDEEDFINELNRKLAHSTLQDSGLAHENRKGWSLSGSPQSTLFCSAFGGCECKQGSSRGSPGDHSQVSSPPKMNNGDGAFDLLRAAAGEVARIRLSEGRAAFHPNQNILYGPPRKPIRITVPPRSPSPNLGFLPNQSHISHQHLKAAHFEQLKQQQMMKQQFTGVCGQDKYPLNHNQAILQNGGRIGGGKHNLPMSAWPALEQSHRQQLPSQQQTGSRMRAVFLGNPISKRECSGTGVFLPRRFGTPAETRKKPGCSTVLLPDRVVQALNNLNREAMDGQVQNRCIPSFGPEYEAASRYGSGTAAIARPRRSMMPQPVKNQELRLPQEWTY